MTSTEKVKLFYKSIFVLMLLYSSYTLYTSPDHWTFMSSVNLIFHEAGHVIFSPFGKMIYLLGGSIMEIFVPTAVAFYFLFQRKLFSASFGIWWLSTALYGVGIYAADAKERSLPLITGDRNTHDWMQILADLGWLRYDDFIGNIFFLLSFVALGTALWFFYLNLTEKMPFFQKR